MCGINGFVAPRLGLSEEHLQTMTACLSHRGPDAEGNYYDPGKHAGLGHRRLSILDLSDAANQPFYSENQRFVIVYNGEVYNFTELRERCLAGESFRTTSDTEVILKLFEKKGTGFIHLLNGMFAIAIIDRRENELFLFRDRLGVKPLYYYWDGSDFIFASELKAILSLRSQLRLAVSPEAIALFLQLGYIPQPFTAFREIRKFPSGNYAVLKNNTLAFHRWWDPGQAISANLISDEREAEEQLDALLNDSVQKRMISDVPFGTFLSGGIDSSLVTAIASRHSAVPLKTFSIATPGSPRDESGYAAKVASRLGTTHTSFDVTEQDAIELLPRMLDVYDEPFADTSYVPTMLVSGLAASSVKMVLTGDGGDELFMGYGAYAWARRFENPLLFALRHPAAEILSLGNQRMQRAAHVFRIPSREKMAAHIFSQEQYLFSEREILRLTGDSGFPALDIRHDFARELSLAEQQAFFDLEYYLRDDLLVKVDRATMRYGLEARLPLLDYRVAEFALNLSPGLKIKDGNAKYLLKKVLYKYLPEEYFDRPKQGFSIPLQHWLGNGLRYMVDELEADTRENRFPYADKNTVLALIGRFRKGKLYLYNRIWALIVLNKFMRTQ